ncbi:protein TFG [Nematostella vectensis]|uniref:protein TFG n=1 Tax=Nematostella vectensis TaxID=45351 RepID=UPI002076E6A8|nr:protein TFG [Nematostella vectensis]
MNYTPENFTLSGSGASNYSFANPQVDLSGKLIIKAQLGDDIRRIPIHNEDLTYDELLLMMQRVFRGKLNSSDDVLIKYKDEDGDLVTIFDSSDLSFAKSMSRILRLTLFVNGIPRPPEHSMVQEYRRELTHIRDRVVYLLDKLNTYDDPAQGSDMGRSPADDKAAKPKGTPQRGAASDARASSDQSAKQTATPTPPPVNTAMFDPLAGQPPQQSHSEPGQVQSNQATQHNNQPTQAYPPRAGSTSQQTQPQSMQGPSQQPSVQQSQQYNGQQYPQAQSYAPSATSQTQTSYNSQSYPVSGAYSQPSSVGYSTYGQSTAPSSSQGYSQGGPPSTQATYTTTPYQSMQQPQLQQQQQQPSNYQSYQAIKMPTQPSYDQYASGQYYSQGYPPS